MYNEYETILKLIENKPKFSECKNECLGMALKKIEVTHSGGGQLSVPTSQSVWTPKIGLIEYLALI